MVRRPAWSLAVALALTASGPARAADIVLVRVPDAPAGTRWRAAENRVRDELRALGLTVADAPVRDTGDTAVTTLLAEHAALAAVQVARAGDRTDVTIWLATPAANGSQRLALTFHGDEHPGIAGLRTAELVRTETRPPAGPAPIEPVSPSPAAPAIEPLVPPPSPPPAPAAPPPLSQPRSQPSLAPLTPPPLTPRPPAPTDARSPQPPSELTDDLLPARPPADAPAPAARHHGLLVAATIGGGPGGAGALTGLELAGRRELGSRLEFGGGVTAMVSPTWQAAPRGSILLGLVAARLTLGLHRQLGPRTSLRLAAGGGLALGWASGRAVSPYRGATDIQPVGMLSAMAGLVVRLRPRAALHAGAAVDVLLPSISIRSGGAEVIRFGLPLVRGVLGLAWDWPLRR